MSQRLLREQRIRSNRDFRELFEKARCYRSANLKLWIHKSSERPRETAARPRIAIMVSKKTDLRAVVRNVWKRRIREIFRKHQGRITASVSMLVQARQKGVAPASRELEEEMMRLLAEARCLK
jgi:ribonuclease P protein component